ncbi:hypothetical protein BDA96_01G505400 [Sorghum bicolor]|uniref:WW domain-containing protein n=1 Tax=Sorghum bicolor TaxID=4558 RepID=A0A921S5E4_SORBI|nr:hypothetical protein BDA96_01G505400 [Sorghum bicolor]
MVSLQSSAVLPEATKRPPWLLSLVGSVVASSTGTAAATSKKRKRDGSDDDRGEVVDGIELNFDAAPLPPEWQRCLDIKSGQIHYYNTRTQKRTWKDPRGDSDYRAAAPTSGEDDGEEEEEDSANCAPPGLDLELNLTFEPRRAFAAAHEKKKPKPAVAADDCRRLQLAAEAEAEDSSGSREMVAGVCVRCHMLVMMCRASPACPNCKFLHPPSRAAAPPPPPEPEPPVPLKLGLQLLCCRD